MRPPDAFSRAAARPIDDRRRTFAVVAALLAAAAAGLQFTATRPDQRLDTADRTPSAAVAGPAASDVPAAQPVDGAEARRVARGFLTRDYLPDLYGHRSGVAYRLAAPALRRQLAEERPRVSPATRRRRPRIRRLTVEPASEATTVRVVATIADGGASTYPIGVEISRDAAERLHVVRLLEAD